MCLMGLSFSLSFGARISLGELSRLKIHLTFFFFFSHALAIRHFGRFADCSIS